MGPLLLQVLASLNRDRTVEHAEGAGPLAHWQSSVCVSVSPKDLDVASLAVLAALLHGATAAFLLQSLKRDRNMNVF